MEVLEYALKKKDMLLRRCNNCDNVEKLKDLKVEFEYIYKDALKGYKKIPSYSVSSSILAICICIYIDIYLYKNFLNYIGNAINNPTEYLKNFDKWCSRFINEIINELKNL